jgi:hypothetical protein
VNSQDGSLRHVIIKLIDQLLRIGNINPIEFVRYVLCYMCDPEPEIRQLAISVVVRMECRFLLHNFKENMGIVA